MLVHRFASTASLCVTSCSTVPPQWLVVSVAIATGTSQAVAVASGRTQCRCVDRPLVFGNAWFHFFAVQFLLCRKLDFDRTGAPENCAVERITDAFVVQ
ncbi:hypothetical protein ANAPC5_01386 [Anaplasma phagocytophilum]|nr:hypothetical protein ANAPC5_01386 [Anaplasma phagocytophilum]